MNNNKNGEIHDDIKLYGDRVILWKFRETSRIGRGGIIILALLRKLGGDVGVQPFPVVDVAFAVVLLDLEIPSPPRTAADTVCK